MSYLSHLAEAGSKQFEKTHTHTHSLSLPLKKKKKLTTPSLHRLPINVFFVCRSVSNLAQHYLYILDMGL